MDIDLKTAKWQSENYQTPSLGNCTTGPHIECLGCDVPVQKHRKLWRFLEDCSVIMAAARVVFVLLIMAALSLVGAQPGDPKDYKITSQK